MKEEPFFLVNEFLIKEKQELQNILETVQGNRHKNIERAVFLRNFTNEMFKAYKKTRKVKSLEDKKTLDIKQKEKDLLVRKKQELMEKLKQLQYPQEIKIPEPSKEKELILSKETGKALVKTEFNGTKYFIKEPELNDQDINLLKELRSTNIEDKQKFVEKIKEACIKLNVVYTDNYYDKLRYYIIRDTKRYGKVSPLIEDKNVKEIICDGAGKPITITYNDKQDILTEISFKSEEELNSFVLGIAQKSNQKVSVENPFLNTNLENFNMQATLGSEFVKAKFVITKL